MKIYLAGPDVFREDAEKYFEGLKKTADTYQCVALSPFDGSIHHNPSSGEIFQANIELMNQAVAVFANIAPFRGPGIDDGTAFEIGYAYARGLRMYGYSPFNALSYPEIAEKYSHGLDADYPVIESFGFPCNLMVAESILRSKGMIFATFEECLIHFISNLQEIRPKDK